MADAGYQVTNDNCKALCSRLGYSLAGTEYAGQCFCDNQLNSLTAQISADSCNMACTGDASQICGGPNALDLYWDGTGSPFQQPDNVTSVASPTTTSTLTATPPSLTTSDSGSTGGLPSLTTLIPSTSDTSSLSSSFDPLTTSVSSMVVVASTPSSATSVPSTPSESSTAAVDSTPPSSTQPLSTTSTTSTVSSSTFIAVPTTTPAASSTTVSTTPSPTVVTTNLPFSFSYQGCYVDDTQARILPVQQPDSSSLTVEGCINTCSALGYSTAGVEYSVQCYCGTSILNGGYLATSPYARRSCKLPCSGDATEGCGGRVLMAVYSNGGLLS
jgi:hypothetical protein